MQNEGLFGVGDIFKETHVGFAWTLLRGWGENRPLGSVGSTGGTLGPCP